MNDGKFQVTELVKIPISVIVVTRNEGVRIGRCLCALRCFDEVIVVDSYSDDGTRDIAKEHGARVVEFSWNGVYPKKRQWCLDNLDLAHDRVFFVDADEVVTSELAGEIAALDFKAAGYFVKGRYVWQGKMLRHGLCNNKLVLFDRRQVAFPIVDDLDCPGMGEIEGHYQPILKAEYEGRSLGQLQHALLHYACDDAEAWEARHQRYALWEAAMDQKGAWPSDPVFVRRVLKRIFKVLPFRGFIAFVHSYILRCGFLDGAAGYDFARSRMHYYGMISAASVANKVQEQRAEI